MQSLLPDYLQDEIKLFQTRDLVIGVKIFSCCEAPLINGIAKILEQRVHVQKDIIFSKISPHEANGMFIVKSGTVNVFHKNQRWAKQLFSGDSFLEEVLVDAHQSTVYLVKTSYSYQ